MAPKSLTSLPSSQHKNINNTSHLNICIWFVCPSQELEQGLAKYGLWVQSGPPIDLYLACGCTPHTVWGWALPTPARGSLCCTLACTHRRHRPGQCIQLPAAATHVLLGSPHRVAPSPAGRRVGQWQSWDECEAPHAQPGVGEAAAGQLLLQCMGLPTFSIHLAKWAATCRQLEWCSRVRRSRSCHWRWGELNSTWAAAAGAAPQGRCACWLGQCHPQAQGGCMWECRLLFAGVDRA